LTIRTAAVCGGIFNACPLTLDLGFMVSDHGRREVKTGDDAGERPSTGDRRCGGVEGRSGWCRGGDTASVSEPLSTRGGLRTGGGLSWISERTDRFLPSRCLALTGGADGIRSEQCSPKIFKISSWSPRSTLDRDSGVYASCSFIESDCVRFSSRSCRFIVFCVSANHSRGSSCAPFFLSLPLGEKTRSMVGPVSERTKQGFFKSQNLMGHWSCEP